MPKIDQLIEDIRELKLEANRRSAHRIYTMLDGHRKEFQDKIDPDYLAMALKSFEALSETNMSQAGSEAFKRDYDKSFEGLLFHLNRIL